MAVEVGAGVVLGPQSRNDALGWNDAGKIRRHERGAPVEPILVLFELDRAPHLEVLIDAIIELPGNVRDLGIGVVDEARQRRTDQVEAEVQALDGRATARADSGAIAVK